MHQYAIQHFCHGNELQDPTMSRFPSVQDFVLARYRANCLIHKNQARLVQADENQSFHHFLLVLQDRYSDEHNWYLHPKGHYVIVLEENSYTSKTLYRIRVYLAMLLQIYLNSENKFQKYLSSGDSVIAKYEAIHFPKNRDSGSLHSSRWWDFYFLTRYVLLSPQEQRDLMGNSKKKRNHNLMVFANESTLLFPHIQVFLLNYNRQYMVLEHWDMMKTYLEFPLSLAKIWYLDRDYL